jgi:hypothetical protein
VVELPSEFFQIDFRSTARRVPKAQNLHAIGFHSKHDAIAFENDFALIPESKFRHNPSALGQGRERLRLLD